MKKEQTKRRVVFMLIAFVLALLLMYWINTQNKQSKDIPEDFIKRDTTEGTTKEIETSSSKTEDSTTKESTTEPYESTYNGEQDIAAQFAKTYLQFTDDSIKNVKEIIDPTLTSKLEQVKGKEQDIDTLSLLDRSKVDDKNIYVYEFKATLHDDKKTKKNGKIFVIMTPQKDSKKMSIVSDLEWTYET